jgi:serine/threonine-protein kinase
MSSGSFDRLPERICGKYRPIRVLGKGGMSVVFEVEHAFTGERLALKVLKGGVVDLDPAALSRFQREARVAAVVKSEHIVRVIDADVAPELEGAPFLVMDLLEGADLATHCADDPQPPERVVGWLSQVARALDKAHALGIVHRDLKPENIFLARKLESDDEVVKILDFGVAKIRSADEARQTATGAVVGTPLYMSPEQARGAADRVGPPTDMWALGLITYSLLTGTDYWNTSSVSALLAKIVYETVEPPSKRGVTFGDAFDDWFLRSCHREPSQRWGTITEQVKALALALEVAVPASLLVDSANRPSRPMPSDPGGLDMAYDETLSHPSGRGASDSMAQPGAAVTVSTVMTPPNRGRRLMVIGAVTALAVGVSWSLVLLTGPSTTETTHPPTEAAQPSASDSAATRPTAPPEPTNDPAPAGASQISESAASTKPEPPAPVARPAPPPRPKSVPPPTHSAKTVPSLDPLADPH